MPDCTEWAPTPDCVSEGPWIAVATYDKNLIQLLCIALPSFVVNSLVVYYYLTVEAHPKFGLRRWRLTTLRLHVCSGTVEILTSVAVWFMREPAPWATAQAVASLVHCLSAILQVPIVFGVGVIMKPAYSMVILTKVYMAANVIAHPTCYVRSLAMFNVLSIYAWCRAFLLFFDRYILLVSHEYTFAILWAGSIVLPMFGFSSCLVASLIMMVYVGLFARCKSKEAFARESVEHARDLFSNSNCPWLQAGGARTSTPQMSQSHAAFATDSILTLAKKAAGPEDEARTIFSAIDTDGSGVIDWDEFTVLLCNFGMPASEVDAVLKDHKVASLTFDTFLREFKPFWTYAFRMLRRNLVRREELQEREQVGHDASKLRAASTWALVGGGDPEE